MISADHDKISLADLIEESYALERSGEVAGALMRAREALEQARASGETEDVVMALACVAHCQHHLGHYE
jgi:hypothetical protein